MIEPSFNTPAMAASSSEIYRAWPWPMGAVFMSILTLGILRVRRNSAVQPIGKQDDTGVDLPPERALSDKVFEMEADDAEFVKALESRMNDAQAKGQDDWSNILVEEEPSSETHTDERAIQTHQSEEEDTETPGARKTALDPELPPAWTSVDVGEGIAVTRFPHDPASPTTTLVIEYHVPTDSSAASTRTNIKDLKAIRAPTHNPLPTLARMMLAFPAADVELTVCPSVPSLIHSDDVDLFEDSGVMTLLNEKAFRTLPMLSRMPDVLTNYLARFLALPKDRPPRLDPEQHFLTNLLLLLRPNRLKLHIPQTELSLYAERNLLPVGPMPLLAAAKQIYTPENPLECLEIGSWIPISEDCSDGGHFTLSEWNILNLCIPYEGVALRDRNGEGAQGAELLPSIIWDPAFGFIHMMKRWHQHEGKDGLQSGRGRLVLLVESLGLVRSFRRHIMRLARLDDGTTGNDITQRLELLKSSIFFVCSTESASSPRRVWKSRSKPKVEASKCMRR